MAYFALIYGGPFVGDELLAAIVDDGQSTQAVGPDDDLNSGLFDPEGIRPGNPKDRLEAMLTGLSYYRLDGPKFMRGNTADVANKVRQAFFQPG